MVIHEALLETVQVYSACVVTDALPVPPEAPKLTFVEEME
jgi:hypothetical protein